MYRSVYIYICIYTYISLCIHVSMHLYICTSIHLHLYVYTHIEMSVCHLSIYLSIVWHHSTQILEACPATNSSDQEDLIRREHLRRPDVVSFARSQSPSSAPQSPRLSPVREMQERCCFPDAVENFCGEGCSAFSLQVAEGSRVK